MKLGQKSVKNLVGFFGDLKKPKIDSEINWPLETPKYILIYILFQVQEQMRQLEEQIRVLVEESFMRKRRRMDPQASTATATSNTQG